MPGDCHGVVPDEHCMFSHPWVADDADMSQIKLQNQLLDTRKRMTRFFGSVAIGGVAALFVAVAVLRALARAVFGGGAAAPPASKKGKKKSKKDD